MPIDLASVHCRRLTSFSALRAASFKGLTFSSLGGFTFFGDSWAYRSKRLLKFTVLFVLNMVSALPTLTFWACSRRFSSFFDSLFLLSLLVSVGLQMLTLSNWIFLSLLPPNDNATPGELWEFLSMLTILGLGFKVPTRSSIRFSLFYSQEIRVDEGTYDIQASFSFVERFREAVQQATNLVIHANNLSIIF